MYVVFKLQYKNLTIIFLKYRSYQIISKQGPNFGGKTTTNQAKYQKIEEEDEQQEDLEQEEALVSRVVEHNPQNVTVTKIHMVLSSHFDGGCKTPGCGVVRPGEPNKCAKVGAGTR